MLPLAYLRENPDLIKEGLTKRNFLQLDLIDQLLDADQNRRSLKVQLDETLSKSNQLAKEIGTLFKTGQTEKANALKAETTALKNEAKQLQEDLQNIEVGLLSLRTQIPNIPDESVP
ncbi:MAG: serine--tRNA ligase, partial [Flavobacteriaceae bacterium]